MAMTYLTKLKPEPMGAHSLSAAYGVNSLVMSEDGASAYISVKDVPAGTPLTNTEYWKIHTDLSTVKQSADAAAQKANAARAEMLEIARSLTDAVEKSGNPVQTELVGGLPFDRVATALSPIRAGSGDPSPDNIRTISGWTGAALTRCGKNLLPDCGNNSATANGITLTCKDGVYKIEGTATTNTTVTLQLSEMMTVPTGTYIHLGNPVADASLIMTLRHTSGTVTNILFSAVNRIASTADFAGKTIQAISVQVGSGKTVNFTFAPMIKLDSAATAYEPYHGNTYTADFGQTVYGGTLDWQTGVLTVDRAIFTLTGEDGAKMTGTSGVRPQVFGFDNSLGILKPANSSIVADALSSHFKIVSWNELTSGSMFDAFAIHANGSIGFAYNGTISDANAWLSGQYAAGTPVQVCYKLATPTTIQLTPQEIKQLQGVNTLYSDGSISMTGRADKALALEARIAALEAAG